MPARSAVDNVESSQASRRALLRDYFQSVNDDSFPEQCRAAQSRRIVAAGMRRKEQCQSSSVPYAVAYQKGRGKQREHRNARRGQSFKVAASAHRDHVELPGDRRLK